MKIDMRRLAMTAVLLSTSTALPAILHAQSYNGDGYADYYGNDGGFSDDSYPHDGVHQTAATMYVGDDASSTPGRVSPSDYGTGPWSEPYPPQSYSNAPGHGNVHGHVLPGGQHHSAASYCDSGCDSRGRGAIGRAVSSGDPETWIKAEMLLWFPQGRQTPPLGVGSAQPGLPTAINHEQLFNDPFGNGLTPGFRGDVGRYFAGGAFGIGGRVWVLGDDSDSLEFSGDGTGVSFGVPFFNTFNANGEDAVLVGFNDGLGTQVVGQAVARSSMSIVAAELYGRARLGQTRNHRLELLGGYSHFNIADDLSLSINRTDLPAGTQTSFNDEFRTRNEFHGGQIGSEISLKRGRWTGSSLTKVHLGNMSQRVAVNGSSTQGIIGDPPTLFGEGLFARGEVQGTRNREVFAFAPEMNLKLGYQFRQHVNFHVGYSFVYWSNVALAGDQMDRNLFVDPTALGNAGPDRFVGINSAGYWVQGVDLGAVIEF